MAKSHPFTFSMEKFCVHILGCGSAKPTLSHLPTAQIVELHGKYYMIDCGEGVQVTMQRLGLSMHKIGHIFISHNHGDHIFGLPGLIGTMGLLGRTAQLHIHGPEDIRPFLDTILTHYCNGMDYEVIFHPVCTREHNLIYSDRSVSVYSLPLEHRIACTGFLFREAQSLPHIRREMIDAYNIPVSQINNIKAGASWTTDEGKVLSHEMLTTPAAPARSYAYCSDTAYVPQLVGLIDGVNLLYHEATYGSDSVSRAKVTKHCTAAQAASIANGAHAKQLVIGHFSARIKDENSLLEEAKSIFPNTLLACEGLDIDIF